MKLKTYALCIKRRMFDENDSTCVARSISVLSFDRGIFVECERR